MSNPAMSHAQPCKPVSAGRKVLTAVLDFITVFAAAGYAVGYLTGNVTEGGFELNGGPALLVFAAIAAYFVVFTRFLGGALWQHLLGAR
jgi:hypothetical protein